MTQVLQPFSTHNFDSAWRLWFAKESDQDLELDDGLDDLDDGRHKPPSRRPLLIIFLLLLVAGAGYVAMNPHLLSSIKGMIVAPGSNTASVEGSMDPAPVAPSTPNNQFKSDIPSPTYEEGEVVAVVEKAGDLSPITLTRDAQQREPGPTVNAGELLTIVDGAFINQSWMYLVHTKSGATGWIQEDQLQSDM